MTARPASPPDVPPAARVLAAAFADYPWTRWTVPADDHERRLEELQALYLAHALEVGIVLVDDGPGPRAVVALLPPDASDPAPEVQERVAALHGDRRAVLAGVALPPAPDGAWSLATLGVHPDHRGGGLGTALARAGLDAAARRGATTVALETSDERNVRLYERLGFAVTARTELVDGPVVWSMTRA